MVFPAAISEGAVSEDGERVIEMFESSVHSPQVFIEALRQFHESDPGRRGELANALSDIIISKRVDLAAVRQLLLDTGESELMDTLDRLIDLIEPYIEEGGVEE